MELDEAREKSKNNLPEKGMGEYMVKQSYFIGNDCSVHFAYFRSLSVFFLWSKKINFIQPN